MGKMYPNFKSFDASTDVWSDIFNAEFTKYWQGVQLFSFIWKQWKCLIDGRRNTLNSGMSREKCKARRCSGFRFSTVPPLNWALAGEFSWKCGLSWELQNHAPPLNDWRYFQQASRSVWFCDEDFFAAPNVWVEYLGSRLRRGMSVGLWDQLRAQTPPVCESPPHTPRDSSQGFRCARVGEVARVANFNSRSSIHCLGEANYVNCLDCFNLIQF